MDSILEVLSGQNSILSSALVGGFFGLIGGLIATFVIKLNPQLARKRKFIYPLIVGLFISIGVAVVGPLVSNAKRNSEINSMVNKLKNEYKAFNVVFTTYPEEEQNFRKLLSEAKSKAEAYEVGKEFGQGLVTRYFLPNLVQAPDSLVNEYIVNSGHILYAVQTNPTACYEYFIGGITQNSLEAYPKDLMQKELDIKGSIIEAGIANDKQISLQSIQDAMKKIYTQYQLNGYDPNDIRTLFSGKNLTPKDGCDIAMRFTYTVALMRDEGAEALKTLIYYQLSASGQAPAQK
jgi:hypothetical protein